MEKSDRERARGTDHVREGFRSHIPLLPELIHVVTEPKLVHERLGVRPESREADEELVVDLKHLLVIGRERLELDAEAKIRRDGHTVLTGHGNDGRTVVRENLRREEKDRGFAIKNGKFFQVSLPICLRPPSIQIQISTEL